MGQSLDGLGDLLQMPYGCGEQNMLHFAPDVYVLKYFEATGQTAGSVVTKARRYINEGISDRREIILYFSVIVTLSLLLSTVKRPSWTPPPLR